VLVSHEFAAAAMSTNGVSWTWRARNAAGYESAAVASEGLISLLRAGHHFSRGLAQVALVALGSYASMDKVIGEIVKRRDDVLKLIWGVTGDGNFKATVDKKPAERTVTVVASGNKLSDVIPIGGAVVPAAAAMWLVFARAGDSSHMHDAATAPPPEPVRVEPVKKKGK
jgi:hypothetical protein